MLRGLNDSPKVMQLMLESGLEFSLFGALPLLTFMLIDVREIWKEKNSRDIQVFHGLFPRMLCCGGLL